jgi:hydrogenase maturation protease
MIMIVGYGNTLRSDDAIGWVLAQQLAQRLESSDVDVRLCLLHQLMPELVEQITEASYVIFLDAREGDAPGMIVCERVVAQPHENLFTHFINPAALLGAAQDWYNTAPHALLISVVGTSFEYGDTLAPEINGLLPRILDDVEELIRSHIFELES